MRFRWGTGWTSRQFYVSRRKKALSSQTLRYPLMIQPTPQLSLSTEPLYGKPYSIKTHLYQLRSLQVLSTQPTILWIVERSQTEELAAVPMLGVINTNMVS